jgi:hypothetical protein
MRFSGRGDRYKKRIPLKRPNKKKIKVRGGLIHKRREVE